MSGTMIAQSAALAAVAQARSASAARPASLKAARSANSPAARFSFGRHAPIRSVVVHAVQEPEPATAEASADEGDTQKERKPRRRFPKRNVTVKDEDIAVGNEYTGKVKRIQDYGCFVDFGARSDGLVHISEMKDGFVESVSDIVSEDQEIQVWIKSIDLDKGRFALTMKSPPTAEQLEEITRREEDRERKFQERQQRKAQEQEKVHKVKAIKKGQKCEGTVKSIQVFGAFVEIAEGVEGLVHVTEMSDDFNVQPSEFVEIGQKVNVRVLAVDGTKIKLSMKEKLDLSELSGDINVDAGASMIEYAFKSKGLNPEQFPGWDALKETKEAEAAAAEAAPEADADEAVAAAVAVADEAAAEEAEPVAEAAAEPEAEPEAEAEPVAEAAAEPEAEVEAEAEEEAAPEPAVEEAAAPEPVAEAKAEEPKADEV